MQEHVEFDFKNLESQRGRQESSQSQSHEALPFATSLSEQSHRAQHMEATAKTQPSRLTPTPKALQQALEKSAKQAQRMAAAFGLTVPTVKPKMNSMSRTGG